MKIFAIHLFNDFSGSPKVLKQSVQAWVKENHDVTIVTSEGREGFLSNIEKVDYLPFWYKMGANKFQKSVFLIWSQILLFFNLIFKAGKEDIIYINTVLPFGAAFVGMVKGSKVIYHIHETSIKPALLKKFLFGIVNLAAEQAVYVSNFLAQQEELKVKNTHILHNAIENNFLAFAKSNPKKTFSYRNVLMVCSLKKYKGVNEFVELANRHGQYSFKLVVNASETEIDQFFGSQKLPVNLEIFSTIKNLHPFFSAADIVLNLSRPDEWVETFGLTVIEAMAYGLPVIVPPVGGVTELVDNGVNGYLADSRKIEDVSNCLVKILEDKEIYDRMRDASLKKIEQFNEDMFAMKSMSIIGDTGIKNQIKTNKLKIHFND